MGFHILLAFACLFLAETAWVDAVPASDRTNRACNCGVKGASSNRIVGGAEATEAEYPWQVALVNFYNYSTYVTWTAPFCGGTIIDQNYVLTAAHCFGTIPDGVTTSPTLRVLIGDHNTTSLKDSSIDDFIAVAEIIRHEEYNNVTIDKDYTLLKLSTPLDFSRTDVGPACIPEADAYESGVTKATVTGWGLTTEGGVGSNVLLEVDIDLVSREQCANDYLKVKDAKITKNMICAKTAGKSSCNGDSGGPLIAKASDNLFEVIGVVSYGVVCGSSDYPVVFADVNAVRNWIGMKVKNDQSSLTCLAPLAQL